MLRNTAVIALVSFLVACGSSDDPGSADGGNTADADPNADAPIAGDAGAGDFQTLITGTWTIPANDETYWCARVTVQQDMYITGFRALSPLGTHHTVLSLGNGSQPDGQFPCTAGTGTFDPALLYASGVGTDDFLFPDGVAVPISAGQQLTLNLHLYNVSDSEISGTSGTLVRTTPQAEVSEFAEMVFAGTTNFTIPPSGSPYEASGSCTFTQDATLLNLWPHMHQSGVHMTVERGADMLLDENYLFNEQKNYPMNVTLSAGDRLDVTCTWINQTGSSIGFGDSSDQEMCFAGFYRYPAFNTGLFCGAL